MIPASAKICLIRLLGLWSALVCLACREEATAVVVEVTSELAVPDDVDMVVIRAQIANGDAQERRVAVGGPSSFPLRLPIIHDSPRADELTVVVEPWLKGKLRAPAQTQMTRFAVGSTRRLTFVLTGVRADGGAVDAPSADAAALDAAADAMSPGPDAPPRPDAPVVSFDSAVDLTPPLDVAPPDAAPKLDTPPPPPDAFVCPAGCVCNRTCSDGACTCSGGCPCTLGCTRGRDCDLRCRDPRTSCNADIAEVPKADLFCYLNATCRFVVAESRSARLNCWDATCSLTCFGTPCELDCANNARCLLRCGSAGEACAMSRCWAGAVTNCGGGMFACGRPCP